ncbi:MAG: cyanophycinase [Bacteroidetes bacterium]|nr:cyanophycinase [Bacteroidota bacterium]
MVRPLLVLSLFFLVIESMGQSAPKGNLVIVGGGLEADNKSIYEQLIAFAGGKEKATFAVIPSASGVPMQSYASFRNILISYGLNPENIHLVNVAMIDDDSTKDVNESEWKDNGNDTRLARIISKCSAVWFTGGDQMRTLKTLYRPDGSQTPVLRAVWDVYRSGGVIGGSSAGAAIMSEVMIGGGTGIAALCHGIIRGYQGNDFPEDTGVLVMSGLGFFPCGLVDQHFNARPRLGRLALALMDAKKEFSLGFGVDENTALIYNSQKNMISVAGASGVTILNASGARISYVQDIPFIENLSLSYLEEGDSYDPATGNILPATGRQSLKGKEHHHGHPPDQAGILSGNQVSLRDLITAHLIDNKETDTVQNVSFVSNTSGFLLTLRKTPLSEGFYSVSPPQQDHFTVTRILMDITPVTISLTPLNNKY